MGARHGTTSHDKEVNPRQSRAEHDTMQSFNLVVVVVAAIIIAVRVLRSAAQCFY